MIPLKDDNPTSSKPVVTYFLIGICVIIFLIQVGSQSYKTGELFYSYGLIPSVLMGHDQLPMDLYAVPAYMTIFSSMFMHGGWIHLIGNMWYMKIFADNIEDNLGSRNFIVFYILCGFAATISQLLINPNSTIPMVGASGAIAGVLGMYMIRFPHARVHVFAFIIIFFTTFRVPAMIVLGFWLFNHLTNGLGSLGFDTTGGVAWFAHIGGFITGIMLNQAFKHIRF